MRGGASSPVAGTSVSETVPQIKIYHYTPGSDLEPLTSSDREAYGILNRAAYAQFTPPDPTRQNSFVTKLFCRVGSDGVNWALWAI